jgi:hypothetical protein
MLKNILAVIGGYVSMIIFLFFTFTILYLILGADGAFKPGSFDVTLNWVIFSFILSFLAAVTGGRITASIADSVKAAYTLAGIVLILGLVMALSTGGSEISSAAVRDGAAGNFEAMQNASTPQAIQFITAFLGFFGVILGARWKSQKPIEVPAE